MADAEEIAIKSLPPKNCRFESVEVSFPNFRSLPAEKGEYVESPPFTAHGHRWQISLYPGGNSRSQKGMVAIYLKHCSDGNINFDFDIKVISRMYSEVKVHRDCPSSFGKSFGFDNFNKYPKLCRMLDWRGTLTVEVRICQLESTDECKEQFVPTNPLLEFLPKLYNCERSSDILFVVDAPQAKSNGRKKAKLASTRFHAHYFLLRECAPALADLCEPYKDKTPVPINGTKPEIFGHILQYVYGGCVPETVLTKNLKDFIDASDKYGVVGLKLKAEALYVKSTEITTNNVIDNLLYADSMNCALLNEAVSDFMVEHSSELEGIVSFEGVPGSVVADILAAITRGERPYYHAYYNDEFSLEDCSSLGVNALRRLCHKKGFDIDGSRKTMIASLKRSGGKIQLDRGDLDPSLQFVPPNPFSGAMQKLFNDEKSADVLFVVANAAVKKKGRKKTKTIPNEFHAHRLILKECAPFLAGLCKSDGNSESIQINDTNPEIFHILLKYVYGSSITKKELEDKTEEIIDAAEKYGIVGLKIEAENYYVKSTSINVDNVASNLHYADEKKCALLNEAAMDFIVENGTEVLEKVSFENVPGIARDILISITRKQISKSCDDDCEDFNMMRVRSLRKKCHEKGLDFGGSREEMIELLKNARDKSDGVETTKK